MAIWMDLLKDDPLPWLLEEANPAVRQRALLLLLDRPPDDPEVVRAKAAAMEADPIAGTLAAQHPEGYWEKSGPGYATKYRGTVWSLIFLDQLGADGSNPRVRAACEYVLSHSQAPSGGFGASGGKDASAPPSSYVIHCLNGNLVRALVGFGWLEDERVQRAIDWEARAVTGEGFDLGHQAPDARHQETEGRGDGEVRYRYYGSGTSGPNFACSANEKQPCAWGAVKALLALARIPEEKRAPHVRRAIQQGVDFLLSRDPAVADYPIPSYAKKPSESWFKLGFPSGYVTDVLQNLEALCELGCGRDPRLQNALQWLLSLQDSRGRWENRYAYSGKTWVDFEKQGEPSKWVTLRACRVLKAAFG